MTETESGARVLLVDTDDARIAHIRASMTPEGGRPTELEVAAGLSSALERLDTDAFDVTLLALDLTEGRGVDAVALLRERAPNTPVVAIVGADDLSAASAAIVAGADDYLTPTDLEGPVLQRAVRYAVERVAMLGELHQRSVVDELTGLYNSSGFQQLATHHLRIADRTEEPVVLVFVKVENARQVGEKHGEAEESRLIADTADVLRRVVRESDVLARVGPEAFCVLLTGNAAGSEAVVLSRLVEAVATRNARSGRPNRLALSVGAVAYDPLMPVELDELIRTADARMRRAESL
ncbi:MAG: diguanylate cyclase [Actinomycetota bacterium]